VLHSPTTKDIYVVVICKTKHYYIYHSTVGPSYHTYDCLEYVYISDERFAKEKKDSVRFSVKFDYIRYSQSAHILIN